MFHPAALLITATAQPVRCWDELEIVLMSAGHWEKNLSMIAMYQHWIISLVK